MISRYFHTDGGYLSFSKVIYSNDLPKFTHSINMYSLNCKGRLLIIDQPVVMGVLNVTPDSFYKGSRIQSNEELISQAGKMLDSGAAILDLGGLSSRTG